MFSNAWVAVENAVYIDRNLVVSACNKCVEQCDLFRLRNTKRLG